MPARSPTTTYFQQQPTGSHIEAADSLLGALFEWRTQDFSMGSVQALIASGRLQRIRDAQLRRLLADWPAQLDDVNEDQELARDFVYATVIPLLAERADIAHLVSPMPKSESGATRMRVDTGVKAIAATRAAQQRLIGWELQQLRGRLDAVMEQLHPHIGRE